MKEQFIDSGTVVVGGAVAGWLSGRQFAAAQAAGMPAGPPGLSRGLLVSGIAAAYGIFGDGGLAERSLELAEGGLSFEVGRMTFQKGASSMSPTVSAVKGHSPAASQQQPNLIDDILNAVRSFIPGSQPPQQPAMNMHSFMQSLPAL